MAFRSIAPRNVSYKVLDEQKCADIFNSALRILSRTGCNVNENEGLELLKEAGCTVEGNHVIIPVSLTQWAIANAPSCITIYDREGEPAMNLSPWHTHFGPAITATKTIDVQTGEARASVTQDAINAALVMDALPNYSYVSALNSASDAPAGYDDLVELNAVLKNTTKPVLYWSHGKDNLAYAFEMFEAIAGGEDAYRDKPFAINLVCPIDPLVHTQEGVSQLIYMARKGSPTVYIPGIAFGLSGPITLAGGIAVGLADTLAGLVIAQLARKGAPFIVAKFNDNFNMRTSNVSFSRPEQLIAQCATSDVFRYIGLPFCSNFGSSDSGAFDQLASFDKTMQVYSAYLSGTNMAFGSGSFECGTLTRLSDLVFCNEVIDFVNVMMAGVEVNDETLAEDDIDEVGPGDNFLTSELTVEHLRDFWDSALFTPRSYSEVCDGTSSTIDARLDARVKEILDAGPKKPLSATLVDKLDQILANAIG